MERLTRRDSHGCAYFDNDGALIRGANGAFHQKKDMTAHYIHDRFVALDKVIDRLAAYEDTELEPEEIVSVQEEPWCVFYFNRRCNLDGDFCPEGPGCPQEMSPEDALRLLKLAQAEKDGRLVVLPDAKYTDADGEKALQKAMWVCGNTNNPVTRYTADAIAEKLCREAMDENPPLTLEQLREMDGEPVYCIGDHEITVNGEKGHQLHAEGWGIVTGTDLRDQGFIVGTAYIYYLEHYGKTWTAYRRKPEEEQ